MYFNVMTEGKGTDFELCEWANCSTSGITASYKQLFKVLRIVILLKMRAKQQKKHWYATVVTGIQSPYW